MDILTCVSTHAPSGTRGGKEDDNVAQKLDVVLQYLPLLSSKLRVRRIELQPMYEISESGTENEDCRNFLYCLRSIGKLAMVVEIKSRVSGFWWACWTLLYDLMIVDVITLGSTGAYSRHSI